MSHSVRSHLRLELDAYDETIRKFIPGYAEGLARAAAEVAALHPARVVDLGTGTGALAAAVLGQPGVGTVECIDVDADMLTQARSRLARFGARARFRQRSFEGSLPRCDAAVASLALHHVPTLARKVAVYRSIHQALRPGGVFANADVTMPAEAAPREAAYRRWARHLVANGIEEARAYEHFAEWSAEDFYFPEHDELDAMRDAGFAASCVWRREPNTLLVGRKIA